MSTLDIVISIVLSSTNFFIKSYFKTAKFDLLLLLYHILLFKLEVNFLNFKDWVSIGFLALLSGVLGLRFLNLAKWSILLWFESLSFLEYKTD